MISIKNKTEKKERNNKLKLMKILLQFN